MPSDSVSDRTACVITTRNRPKELANTLERVSAQTTRPDIIIVIDNASDPETREIVAAFPTVVYQRSERNLGGAGGFALGIMLALANGAHWIWVMDDDGFPANADCLATLISAARKHKAGIVGAMVVDVKDHTRLAFPFRIRSKYKFLVSDLDGISIIFNAAHLFNGTLFDADIFDKVGLPDLRLFIRGDEVDFLARAKMSGIKILTTLEATFIHPASTPEIIPIINGRLHVVMPTTPMKQFYQFRNRGYIFPRRKMIGYFIFDFIRYGAYFLICQRGDFCGYQQWLRWTFQGAFGHLQPWPQINDLNLPSNSGAKTVDQGITIEKQADAAN